eukprot:70318-Pleurochrysis_carterae.AAC.1
MRWHSETFANEPLRSLRTHRKRRGALRFSLALVLVVVQWAAAAAVAVAKRKALAVEAWALFCVLCHLASGEPHAAAVATQLERLHRGTKY